MPAIHDQASSQPTRESVDGLAGATLLNFGTEWCGYCVGAQRLIDQALVSYPQVVQVKIEDGPGRPLGRSFRVKLWPTLVFLRDGREVTRLVRPTSQGPIEDALGLIATPSG
jgi:thioredoxin 1